MIKRLLDSVILIDHLNAIDAASDYIRSLAPEETAISVITYAEIMVGIENEDREMVRSFLYQFTIFPIDVGIAEIASDLRQKHSWKLPDAFQAAIAVHHNIQLITRNTKDFSSNRHPFVKIPYIP